MNFDRFANDYTRHALVQLEMAKLLTNMANLQNHQSILDIGCGAGAVYESLSFTPQKFVGVDMSNQMLKIHPKDKHVELIQANFDDTKFWQNLNQFETIISCGALQWSKNLDILFLNISNHCKYAYLAIFTIGTLHSLRKITNQDSFLPDTKRLDNLANANFFDCQSFVVQYRLYFDNKKSMFRHLKLTGVHFGKRLDYKSAKKLLNEYNLDYLEFEAWFCKCC